MAVDLSLATRIVDFLNELLAIDSEAITAICKTRVRCNELLKNHPTVQVKFFQDQQDQYAEVGMIGILNGMCGAYDDGELRGWGCIVAHIEEDGFISRFSVLTQHVGVK